MERNRAYYRRQRDRAIKRKYAIQEIRMGKSEAKDLYEKYGKLGELSKGKVHCSCPMCRTKSYDELSRRDKALAERADFELNYH